MILSMSSFIFIAFIIPSLATGYNVYNVTNKIVLHTYYDAYVPERLYNGETSGKSWSGIFFIGQSSCLLQTKLRYNNKYLLYRSIKKYLF